MVELAVYVALAMLIGISLLLWEMAKLAWRFLVWATEPIREELAFQRMIREQREKEKRMEAAHQEAMLEIDQVVAHFDQVHEEAFAQPDHESGQRQSG